MNQEKKLIEEKNKMQQNNIKGLKNYMNSNLKRSDSDLTQAMMELFKKMKLLLKLSNST